MQSIKVIGRGEGLMMMVSSLFYSAIVVLLFQRRPFLVSVCLLSIQINENEK